MHLHVCGGEEKARNTYTSSLASPGQAGHGEAIGAGERRACE
jgi:hypothetical protein